MLRVVRLYVKLGMFVGQQQQTNSCFEQRQCVLCYTRFVEYNATNKGKLQLDPPG